MLARFFQRRSIWWPTWSGWLLLGLLGGAPVLLWVFRGEEFLSHADRLPADALIVEGWIGIEGVREAKAEFDRGGYRYLVTAGGLSENRWGTQRWNYATEAAELLLRLKVPADRLVEAPAQDTEAGRTFASAVAVRQTLAARGIHLRSANVLTYSVHVRRSRLVFSKVLGPGTKVGAVSLIPPRHAPGSWWKSSERAVDLMKETVGYAFELFLNSGRFSNSPAPKNP